MLRNAANVFIYDNSVNPQINPSELPKHWIYIRDNNNSGLSVAYNRAAQYAKENGYEWLLLTDQDTTFPENALEKYLEGIRLYPEDELFCPIVLRDKERMMSPCRCYKYLFYFNPYKKFGDSIDISKYSIINSGMMINIKAFLSVDGYDEKVFLDFSDFQFLERFRKKQKKARIVGVRCQQSFSNEDQEGQEKIGRFRLFCKSIKNFKPKNKIDKFWIHCIVIKRALGLSIASRSFEPFNIMFKTYMK